jgi:hypothetical protein
VTAPTLVVPSEVSLAGCDAKPATADTTNGNSWANNGRDFVYIYCGSGTVHAHFHAPCLVDGHAIGDTVVDVEAGVGRVFGPFHPTVYNDANDLATVTYAGTLSDVRIKVLRRPA